MATLREPVKIFIVQSLACFETPQQVVDAVREEFGIEIERQQVASYDPTKATCRGMSKKLKDLFTRTRKDFKSNIYDIPLANKAVRLARQTTSESVKADTVQVTESFAEGSVEVSEFEQIARAYIASLDLKPKVFGFEVFRA